MIEYPLGLTLNLECTFYDENNQPVDPATIDLKVVKFDGSSVTMVETAVKNQMTSNVTGTWSYPHTPADAGIYGYRFVGTTGGVSITHFDGKFQVVASDVAAA